MIDILFCDLDNTLITTISGKTFPEGIWDMKPRLEVWDAIKVLNPNRIYIVSNQGGVELGYCTKQSIITKLGYICRCIQDYTGIITKYDFCTSNDKDNKFRKPNPGMVSEYITELESYGFDIGLPNCLMIGDASGKPGQWSDTDKQTAINAGILYSDVDDFINEMKISNGSNS